MPSIQYSTQVVIAQMVKSRRQKGSLISAELDGCFSTRKGTSGTTCSNGMPHDQSMPLPSITRWQAYNAHIKQKDYHSSSLSLSRPTAHSRSHLGESIELQAAGGGSAQQSSDEENVLQRGHDCLFEGVCGSLWIEMLSVCAGCGSSIPKPPSA